VFGANTLEEMRGDFPPQFLDRPLAAIADLSCQSLDNRGCRGCLGERGKNGIPEFDNAAALR
jgi:hypothetical protein